MSKSRRDIVPETATDLKPAALNIIRTDGSEVLNLEDVPEFIAVEKALLTQAMWMLAKIHEGQKLIASEVDHVVGLLRSSLETNVLHLTAITPEDAKAMLSDTPPDRMEA